MPVHVVELISSLNIAIPAFTGSVLILLYVIRIRYRAGLRQVPGPFFASFLPLDRVLSSARGHQYAHHITLHEKHGSQVRVGPNHVSISNPDAISVIYGISTKFYKVAKISKPTMLFY